MCLVFSRENEKERERERKKNNVFSYRSLDTLN